MFLPRMASGPPHTREEPKTRVREELKSRKMQERKEKDIEREKQEQNNYTVLLISLLTPCTIC